MQFLSSISISFFLEKAVPTPIWNWSFTCKKKQMHGPTSFAITHVNLMHKPLDHLPPSQTLGNLIIDLFLRFVIQIQTLHLSVVILAWSIQGIINWREISNFKLPRMGWLPGMTPFVSVACLRAIFGPAAPIA